VIDEVIVGAAEGEALPKSRRQTEQTTSQWHSVASGASSNSSSVVATATEGEVQQKEAVGTNHSSAVVAQQTPAEAGTIL
jgi:hypothetical protein